MKKVLIIAYYYPPTNNGGVQRPYSFVKYLPRFGFQPLVFTVKTREARENEASIIRIEDPWLEFSLKGQISSYMFRGFRKIFREIGLIKSNFHWWYKKSLLYMDRLISEHKPDIVFATFPPQETLMIGSEISRKYAIPLVLDFRDGMVFEPLEKMSRWKLSRKIAEEAQLVSQSSHIVTVSAPITKYFQDHYPERTVTTITNGFDPEEVNAFSKMNLGNRINIVYTGRLGLSRKESGASIFTFLDVLSALSNEERGKVRLHMVGEFSLEEKKKMARLIDTGLISLVGLVDRQKALMYQRSADLLLLVVPPEHKSVATGKIFEYLASGRPILALTRGTTAEEIIRKTHTGICLDPDDRLGIERFLRKILNKSTKFDFFYPDSEAINKYNRVTLAEELAGILGKVLDSSRASS